MWIILFFIFILFAISLASTVLVAMSEPWYYIILPVIWLGVVTITLMAMFFTTWSTASEINKAKKYLTMETLAPIAKDWLGRLEKEGKIKVTSVRT